MAVAIQFRFRLLTKTMSNENRQIWWTAYKSPAGRVGYIHFVQELDTLDTDSDEILLRSLVKKPYDQTAFITYVNRLIFGRMQHDMIERFTGDAISTLIDTDYSLISNVKVSRCSDFFL